MAIGADSLVMVLADGCLAAARRAQAGGDLTVNGERLRLLAIGLVAVESLLGPDAPCGLSYQAEARRGLSDLYARFTEGFGFPDLQEAARLIGDTG